MSEKKKEEAAPHDHVWGKWFPFDQFHKWRQCVIPHCYEYEKEKAQS